MNKIRQVFEESRIILDDFLSDDNNMKLITGAGEIMVKSLSKGGKIISCGNGGSMCDAMHFAEELTGKSRYDRPSIPAIAISDPAYITCTANDYGFDHIFSRFIEGTGKRGDVLLAISTSGNSVNVLNAAIVARQRGMKVVGLTGNDGGGLGGICDIVLRVPGCDFPDKAQEMHVKIIHAFINYIENNL
jgi:D-sedoheptulose 7-phosphate isomerase